MKPVSAAYKKSMKSNLRDRSFVKVYFKNIDTTAASDGSWSSDDQLAYSNLTTLDLAHGFGATVAALELNRWALDGSNIILPDGVVNDGYISETMSDEDGNYSEGVTLDRLFSLDHSFAGVTVLFDTRMKEYPKAATLAFYDGDTLLYSMTPEIIGPELVVDEGVATINKIVLTFTEGLPYRRVRLQRFSYGVDRTFTNEDLNNTYQSHDVDPLSRRLPSEYFEFTLIDYDHQYDPDNPTGIYAYVDGHSPISIQFGYMLPTGVIEWIKPDNYILSGSPSIANDLVTFRAAGMISGMGGTYYKGTIGSKNFYDLAVAVLTDANLGLTDEGANPWDIDETLKQMYTTAAMPIDTHMNCLQLIAHACRCRMFTDDDNVIHLQPFGVTAVGIYSGSFSDNGHLAYSEWGTVDRGNGLSDTYVALELNRWTLNGESQVIIPDLPVGHGYIGEAMSDADGVFSTDPQFIRTFNVNHDLPTVTLCFDMVTGEYPLEIEIKYYDGNTLLDTQTAYPDNGEFSVDSSLAIDCTKIEVSFPKALPYRRVRISKVYYRETDYTLDFTTVVKDKQTMVKVEQLKKVSVAKYVYQSNGTDQTLYEDTTPETNLHIEFPSLAENVSVAVTGGTVVSSAIYARAMDLVLSAGEKTIVVTGDTLAENTVIKNYPVSLNGETDKEENPLITNDTMADALAEHVTTYLQLRNTYDVQYRGNPELEAGDIVGLQTPYTDEVNALILVDEITFNGSLSGKVKVKGLL